MLFFNFSFTNKSSLHRISITLLLHTLRLKIVIVKWLKKILIITKIVFVVCNYHYYLSIYLFITKVESLQFVNAQNSDTYLFDNI